MKTIFLKLVITIGILVHITSCNTAKHDHEKALENAVSMSTITSDYDSLIVKVKTKGDIDAYSELFYGFIDSDEISRTDSVMYYAEIMVKYHNFEGAYYDYINALLSKWKIQRGENRYQDIDISKMDKKDKKKAIDWLKIMLQKELITEEEFNSIQK